MPLPTLPPELIRFIVQLVADISSDKELFRPLAECCLASKTFLPFAREELYRYVEVFQDSGATNLLRTVITAPHLAALIRTLRFELGRSAPWRSPTGEEIMPRIVAGCVNVTAIFIYSCGQGVNVLTGGAVQRAVASSAETLETLEVEGDCCWEPEDLSKMLFRLSCLNVLRLDDADTQMPLSLSPPPTFRLRRFETRRYMDGSALAALLENSTSSLEALSFAGAPDYAALPIERFTRLGTVTLHWPPHLYGIAPTEGMFDCLSRCTALTSVRFADADARDEGLPPKPFEATLPLLRILPPSLTQIVDSGWLHLDNDTLRRLFSDRHLLPNLRRFFLPSRERNAEGEWQKLRVVEEIESLTRAVALRGVELHWSDPRSWFVDD